MMEMNGWQDLDMCSRKGEDHGRDDESRSAGCSKNNRNKRDSGSTDRAGYSGSAVPFPRYLFPDLDKRECLLKCPMPG